MNPSHAWRWRKPAPIVLTTDSGIEPLTEFAHPPTGLLLRYIGRHAPSHVLALISIFAAVGCALASQWAIKILEGFSLRIRADKCVGIMGPSGTGKSTVFALLQHYHEPKRGSVRTGGQDISQVTLSSLQDAVAVVPQDISLFHRALLENLRYGEPGATREDVRAAADHASCVDPIAFMTEGLDSIVGDRGVKLSGGQPQRIAVARAILKKASILLMHEATSSFDSASESAIQTTFERLVNGRKVLAIAHRISALQNFDCILVVHRGRAIDKESAADLASRPGMDRDVLDRQMQRPSAEGALSRLNAASTRKAHSKNDWESKL